ncbi:MAG TPA: fluoride efflux transporter CrcB [Longimicrobiales bacterium]|nr:fluoride efflux transporter CrcB [Longimicrobiales bacterium]
MIPLVVFLGAGVGGLARYAVGGWIQQAAGAGFPWGTLVVNITGSLLLAFLYAFLEGTIAAPQWRALLGVGFCGGYTTFSTFSYETVRLLQDGQWSRASWYVLGSVLVSLVAAAAGFRIAATVLQRG